MTTASFQGEPHFRGSNATNVIGHYVESETVRFDGNDHSLGSVPPATGKALNSIALVDDRTLRRECLRNSLILQHVSWDIAAFDTVEEWRAVADLHPPLAAVLLHIGKQNLTYPDVAERIRKLTQEFDPKPVIILSDSDDIVQIINAIDCGVRGYIPSSVTVEVCIEAIKLVLAGCIFLPASSVLARRHDIASDVPHRSRLAELFTPRQIKVADAIRQGKPNKIIAYEMDMCESTVKVHVRNIMKKLNATNRTEIAYKLTDMFAGG